MRSFNATTLLLRSAAVCEAPAVARGRVKLPKPAMVFPRRRSYEHALTGELRHGLLHPLSVERHGWSLGAATIREIRARKSDATMAKQRESIRQAEFNQFLEGSAVCFPILTVSEHLVIHIQ